MNFFKDKKYYLLLVLLVSAAFIIRLVVICALVKTDLNVLFPPPATDMATYYKLGKEIAEGTFHQLFYYQPFYYAVFLGTVFRFFTENMIAVFIFQAFIGALTVFFAAESANKLWSEKAGLITAFLLLFSRVLIYYSSYLLPVTIQAFWLSVLLYFTIRAFRSRKTINWMFVGFILGCSILTRGNMWILVPGFIILSFVKGFSCFRNGSIIKRTLPMCLFLFFLIAPMLPFIYINSEKSGRLTGPSTAAGAVLLFGNTPLSPPGGNEAVYGAGLMKPTESGKYWNKFSDRVSIPERIYSYWSRKPLAFIELTFRKLLLFWDSREIPNNTNIYMSLNNCKTLRYLGIIPSFIFLILGGAGLVFFIPSIFRKKSELIIPLYIIIAYWFSIALFYNLCRFRAPLLPVYSVYAGAFTAYLFSYSGRKYINLLTAFFLIILFTFISFFSYDYYRFYLEKKVMRYVRPWGTEVSLGDKSMIADNGPLLYGSWDLLPLKEGIVVEKKFSLNSIKKFNNIIFEMPVIFTETGYIVIGINGSNYTVVSQKKEKVELTCNLKDLKYLNISETNRETLKIYIKIIKIKGKACCIVDRQRNYNRTAVNNKNISAELVSRIFIFND
ncbi:MAG: glycosyltransferase family 39 protein [Victivallales bacterium]|nr:glycosyltransferase family 39 protein [Victivallales bacterium]